MASKWIEIAGGDGAKFRGYLAVPASGKGPGIVLCQEIFGINAYVRETADYYAEEGYVVLAPDLFWRMEPNVETIFLMASDRHQFIASSLVKDIARLGGDTSQFVSKKVFERLKRKFVQA